jgi:hypothetical protein
MVTRKIEPRIMIKGRRDRSMEDGAGAGATCGPTPGMFTGGITGANWPGTAGMPGKACGGIMGTPPGPIGIWPGGAYIWGAGNGEIGVGTCTPGITGAAIGCMGTGTTGTPNPGGMPPRGAAEGGRPGAPAVC